jgi:hypothetical protein
VKQSRPKIAAYVLAAVAIATVIWTTMGSPHSQQPVAQQLARYASP